MPDKRLRVLYDHQIFSMQSLGGISRYYVELVERYENQADVEVHLGAKEVLTFDLRDTATYRGHRPRPSTLLRNIYGLSKRRVGVDLMYWSNKRFSLNEVIKGDFDIFHPTYYDPYFLDAIGEKPFYLEVHDMTHEVYPEFFPLASKIPDWKRALVEKASRIVTVSENTRQDLIRFYGVEPERVRTIRQGISLHPERSRSEDTPPDLPSRYVLFVGTRASYKNFYLFAEAVAAVMKEDRDLWLVCAGGGALTSDEMRFLSRLGIEGRTRQYGINDSSLCQLYARAKAFIFPSLYEGFGLPVLEAFACGCPAVLADTSSLPELGGEAAAYFAPKSFDSMKGAISRVTADDEIRIKMIQKGRERARLFSWDRTAEETKKVYMEMAGR
ncbi:MAG: glycosyltransferase family 1 protein [Methanomassiliicoccus sp.]|nr:glycosyltransferase family 1 protein [Methanomassiliicoccus sp.]